MIIATCLRRRKVRTALAICAATWFSASICAQAVLTWHNDNARTGQNLQEVTLTPANVNASTFGKLFVIPVDGKVDAQPLYVPSRTIPGKGTHNVLYVVTEHDSAYAFDADLGTMLWHVSLLGANETTSDIRGCFQVVPEIGITSTPAIDPQIGPNGTMYVVAMSKDGSGNYHQRLHALDLTTGAEEFGGPTEIQATYPGSGAEGSGVVLTFDPKLHKERAALLIVNGVVYTSWSSHCDDGPYTSWVIGYDAATLRQVSVLNLIPNGTGGGIWSAGAGPAADASGNLYLLMGNGTFDATLSPGGFPVNQNYGNAFVKISTEGRALAVTDYFTMSNTASESNADLDLGSGGILLLPPLNDSRGNPRSLAVGAGKDQNIYVVDRNNLGKFNPRTNAIYQELPQAVGPVYSSPAWFNGTLYYGGVGDVLRTFPFTNGALGPSPASQSLNTFGYPGTTPSISANGTSNGIVWAAENGTPAVLHAYDASNLSRELYNSNQAPDGRDQFGDGNKFIVPTVVNGRVYVGTTTGVGVFGLFGTGATTTMSLSRTSLKFGVSGSLTTDPQSITVTFSGNLGVSWTVSANQPNITVSPTSGTGNGSFQVTATAGASGTVTVTAPGAINSPLQVQVNVASVATGSPYGSFDTPVNNTTGIAGAIAVTGWALDNIEVSKVDIWRERIGSEPTASNGLVYVGDAVFVAGARPDVETAYPNAPFNYRAGWGYLMLTTGLPNNGGSPGPGNGTYKLHAIAHNKAGTAVDLGTRTITVDNAHATKPFGTLDTPGQGATVSGTVINFGWALTQQPYVIPADGSTIWVTVDGQVLGHPVYNQYRSDIAIGFPGLANSNGAVGYFYIDTSTLTNGVHNIGWLVYDNAGRGDGVGSRFFTVLNSGAGAAPAAEETAPVLATEAIKLRRGYNLRREPELLAPDRDGILSVEMEELGRIELHLAASAGYLVVNGERSPLPIGSSLKAGVFYWQLSAGVLGDFDLVFLRNQSGGSVQEVTARVHVGPRK